MIRTFRAPGRVNLIGEHTDYNGGFVFPTALDLFCEVKTRPNGAGNLIARSGNFQRQRSWTLSELSSPTRHGEWSDYVAGVAVELIRLGVGPVAAELEIQSGVPIGSGLSSSASLEVSVGLALSSLAGVEVPKKELALACQRAENDFVGMKCGIMDQFVSALGKAGHAILIDCRSLEHRAVPLPAGLELVIVNSMVKHELASSEYNTRRRECEQAVKILGKPLREIDASEWPSLEEELPDIPRRRARHVITENARVLAFVEACQRNDREAMGRLMAESHRSMRDDYQITCTEIDCLVETASKQPGLVGARMTGGGFGGCTINLVQAEAANRFRETVATSYEQKTGLRPEIYSCQTADGAREIESTP